jgi:hypothetical protein
MMSRMATTFSGSMPYSPPCVKYSTALWVSKREKNIVGIQKRIHMVHVIAAFINEYTLHSQARFACLREM